VVDAARNILVVKFKKHCLGALMVDIDPCTTNRLKVQQQHPILA